MYVGQPVSGTPLFRVAGFRGQEKLVETIHSSEVSAFVEIEAWKARMRRGEVSRIELIDLRPNGELTNLTVCPETGIMWSWLC